MMGRNAQKPLSGRQLAGCLFLAALVAGCGGRDSPEQEIERRRKEFKEPVVNHAEFSGTVTIDKQSPEIEPRHVLLLMLYDPKSPPTETKPPRYAIVQNNGTFKFGKGGVPPGSYVALFAELQRGRPGTFRGPDLLKNLYNDPDKNQNIEAFKVDVPQSGKTQNFNLEVSGKDPVTPRGEHSIVQFFAPPQ
jgi:hypothetical protein